MNKAKNIIIRVLDLFYPLVSFMPKQTYYYAACGGINTVFGLAAFYFAFHYLIDSDVVHFYAFSFKSHVAALIFSSTTAFPTSFILTKFIVWSESNLDVKTQLLRHAGFAVLFTFMNYWLLIFFVEYFNWWPFPSQLITTTIIIICSYLAQKYISFKKIEV